MEPGSRRIVFEKPVCNYNRACFGGYFFIRIEPEQGRTNILGDYCTSCFYLKWIPVETIPCEEDFLQKIHEFI